MAIYGRNWVLGIGRTRTETVIYWKNVGKKAYRNVEKKRLWSVFDNIFIKYLLSKKHWIPHAQNGHGS